MRLADNQGTLESATVADLTMRNAETLLAEPRDPDSDRIFAPPPLDILAKVIHEEAEHEISWSRNVEKLARVIRDDADFEIHPMRYLFDRLALITTAFCGNIETGELIIKTDTSARARVFANAEANLRCERAIGLLCKTVEERGFPPPYTFRYWPGPVPHLDLQVLEVKYGRNQHLQIRTEDDLVCYSEELLAHWREVRAWPSSNPAASL